MAGMLTFIPVFALFPIMSALAKEAQAVTTLVWIIAGFQTLLSIAVSLSYGASLVGTRTRSTRPILMRF